MDARSSDPPLHCRRQLGVLLHVVPKGQKLVVVEGRRWAIEDSFETSKNELGLDHNETRSWHGWHRRVSLESTRGLVDAPEQHVNRFLGCHASNGFSDGPRALPFIW
jgi:hypothetical protein